MRLCTLGPLVGYDGHIAATQCYTAMTIVTLWERTWPRQPLAVGWDGRAMTRNEARSGRGRVRSY